MEGFEEEVVLEFETVVFGFGVGELVGSSGGGRHGYSSFFFFFFFP